MKLTTISLFLIFLWSSLISSAPFPSELYEDIESMDEYNKILDDYDFLSVLVFYAESDQETMKFLSPLFLKAAKMNKGFAKFYSVNCDLIYAYDPEQFPMCGDDGTKKLPIIKTLTPPILQVDPSTKKRQNHIIGNYSKVTMTEKDLNLFILNAIPNFTMKMESQRYFGGMAHIKFYNKLWLFSKKGTVSPLFKALASNYHRKLLLGVFAENQDEKEAMEFFKVDKFPTLVLEETINSTDLKEYTEPKFHIYTGKVDLPNISKFLKKFARETPLDEEEENDLLQAALRKAKEKKEEKKTWFSWVGNLNFSSEVLVEEKGALLFLLDDIENQIDDVIPITKEFEGSLNFFIMDVSNEKNEEYAQTELKTKEYPSLKFLEIGKTGKEKQKSMKNIRYTTSIPRLERKLGQEIPDKMLHIAGDNLNSVLPQYQEEGKIITIFFTRSETAPISLQALANDPNISPKVLFITYKDPVPEVLKSFQIEESKLPMIGGLLPFNKDDKGYKVWTYPSTLWSYTQLKEFISAVMLQTFGEGAATTPKKRATKLEELGIGNMQKCTAQKGMCVIGLLSGAQTSEEEKSKHMMELEILKQLKTKKSQGSIHVSWLNASCHSELLTDFKIEPSFIPTILAYLPTKQKYSNLIGEFSYSNIEKFVNNVIKSRNIPYFSAPEELRIAEKDCPNIVAENPGSDGEDSALEREIMLEMQKEEDARKKLEEAEQAGSKGKKKRKKRKKKVDL